MIEAPDGMRALVVEAVARDGRAVEEDPREAVPARGRDRRRRRATARSKLADGGFQLVTLDFMLPDGRGLDFLEEIAGRGETPRVIMVTGHGDEETAVRSFRLQRVRSTSIKDARLALALVEAVEKG